MELPLEGLDKDQLTQKRATRTLNIQLIKADTPEKIVQVAIPGEYIYFILRAPLIKF